MRKKRKKEEKPPKAKRTQTMSKKVGVEFIKAQEALGEDLPDRAMDILTNLLRRDDLRPFEQAQIIRLQAYVYAEKEDYDKSLDYLQRVFSLNALQPQDQLDLQFQIAQLYLATDKWNEGHQQLLRWFYNAEEMDSTGPSAHALLAQIYLYFASETERDSPKKNNIIGKPNLTLKKQYYLPQSQEKIGIKYIYQSYFLMTGMKSLFQFLKLWSIGFQKRKIIIDS